MSFDQMIEKRQEFIDELNKGLDILKDKEIISKLEWIITWGPRIRDADLESPIENYIFQRTTEGQVYKFGISGSKIKIETSDISYDYEEDLATGKLGVTYNDEVVLYLRYEQKRPHQTFNFGGPSKIIIPVDVAPAFIGIGFFDDVTIKLEENWVEALDLFLKSAQGSAEKQDHQRDDQLSSKLSAQIDTSAYQGVTEKNISSEKNSDSWEELRHIASGNTSRWLIFFILGLIFMLFY